MRNNLTKTALLIKRALAENESTERLYRGLRLLDPTGVSLNYSHFLGDRPKGHDRMEEHKNMFKGVGGGMAIGAAGSAVTSPLWFDPLVEEMKKRRSTIIDVATGLFKFIKNNPGKATAFLAPLYAGGIIGDQITSSPMFDKYYEKGKLKPEYRN